jgi:CxxC-x17-CxxC domain-containing protein
MGKFNKDNRSGGDRGRNDFGGSKFGGRNRGFGGRNTGRPAMFKAVCAKCGKECEVPFRPTEGRPIYCSECFGKQEDRNTGRPAGGNFHRPSFGDKKMFEAICAQCGKKCEVPFQPSPGKPVYCSDCFGKNKQSGGGANADAIMEKLRLLDNKLDSVLKSLGRQAGAEIPAEKTAKKAEGKKPAKGAVKQPKSKVAPAKTKAAVKKTKK